MDAKEYFGTELPKKLAADPASARSVAAVFQINVTGDGGGSWNVDLKNDPPVCKECDDGIVRNKKHCFSPAF